MKFQRSTLLLLSALAASNGFAPAPRHNVVVASKSALSVSIGLGPEENAPAKVVELVAGVDYEVPDHEMFRLARRSSIDEKCDEWFGALLAGDDDEKSVLGPIADKARTALSTPVELKNDVRDEQVLLLFR
jgi:hypothetical protein